MPTNCIAELAPPPSPINRSMRNPASFYLSTLRKMEGHGEMGLIAESFNPNMLVRMRSDEYESRSGSDNFEFASGDDQEGGDGEPPRKKKYHRHTPHQIQELETFFKECPHPDEKQRLDLSRRLGLETKQVKFWFQNRRTQMKTQIERHENVILRQENEKLRAENSIMKDALGNPICNNCGGPAIPVQISMEEHHLRVENARLKEELSRLCALSNKFLVKQNPFLDDPLRITNASIGLELGVGRNSTSAGVNSSSSLPMRLSLGDGLMDTSLGLLAMKSSPFGLMGNEVPVDRSMLVELALNSMDELVKMAQAEGPLWIKALDGMEVLNREEYLRNFAPCLAPKPTGYVTEATRQSGLVIINSVALVETLMDAGRWQEMFPGLIASAATLDLVSNGMNGSPNGTLQVMNAEIQLLSPLIPIRQLRFIRFCKQHAEGLWAVVDVSMDIGLENTGKNPCLNCRKLPSGCIVQDMPNGYSKVIWIEHSEYDDSLIPQLYRPLLSSGIGFGANRWIATLQRQCECLAILMHPSMPNNDHSAISQAGKRSMLKLAQRMTDSFCYGICPSSVRKWEKLSLGNLDNDMRVMARKNVDDPGEPPGFLLSAATSVWMPVSRQKLFNFLRNEQLRSEWDILSNGGPMHEMVHIAKGQGQGNCVSLLRSNTVHANESSVLILQETWTDASCSAIVYAPVDVDSLNIVMSGGDSAYVPLLPSGFAILPDARSGYSNGGVGDNEHDSGGSLLTVGFQILVSSVPSPNLTSESVDTLNNVIANTVQRIKTVLHVE